MWRDSSSSSGSYAHGPGADQVRCHQVKRRRSEPPAARVASTAACRNAPDLRAIKPGALTGDLMSRRPRFILAAIFVAALSSAAASEKPPENQHGVTPIDSLAPMPRDATALCVDGTWSSAENRRGTCSGHGGMKEWFGKPPKAATSRCKDGTYSKAKDTQGACSRHGGIAFKFQESKLGN